MSIICCSPLVSHLFRWLHPSNQSLPHSLVITSSNDNSPLSQPIAPDADNRHQERNASHSALDNVLLQEHLHVSADLLAIDISQLLLDIFRARLAVGRITENLVASLQAARRAGLLLLLAAAGGHERDGGHAGRERGGDGGGDEAEVRAEEARGDEAGAEHKQRGVDQVRVAVGARGEVVGEGEGGARDGAQCAQVLLGRGG